jgi:hypothetical protein
MTEQPKAAAPASRGSRVAYTILCHLVAVDVAIQFYFAAVGSFTKPANDSQYILHQLNGRIVMPLLMLLTILAAVIAKAPRQLIWFTALPLGLLVIQNLIIVLSDATATSDEKSSVASEIIFGLHGLNGLIILGVAGALVARSRKLLKSTVDGSAPVPQS